MRRVQHKFRCRTCRCVCVTTQVGTYYLANLTDAQITQISSTTVQVDAGMAPQNGWGIEVRAHDYGWGATQR